MVQKKSQTKLETSIIRLKKTLAAYIKAKLLKLSSAYNKTRLFFVGIPGWIRTRPQAFKDWKSADKKKKKYRSFRLQKRIKPEVQFVPSAGQLLRQSFRLYRKNFWVFFFIMFVHALLYYLFIRTASGFDLNEVKDTVGSIVGSTTSAEGTFAILGSLLGNTQQREGSQLPNALILLFISLSTIWVIRRLYSGTAFKIRDAFYQSLSSFVPFILVLFVMTLQALPFTIASYVYVVGRTSNIFITGFEDLSFFLVALFCGILSLYWMTPTIISLYAVTLPNMYPLRTIRLSKKIVRFRRLIVFRRIIAFPVLIAIISGVILLAVVRFIPQYSPFFVDAFPIMLLPILHGYYFNLYKSLV